MVGQFKEAGYYLGKEDFEVNRNGYELHVRGKTEDPLSCALAICNSTEPFFLGGLHIHPHVPCTFRCVHAQCIACSYHTCMAVHLHMHVNVLAPVSRRLVAGLDEKIKLPLDADWNDMEAEFKEHCLRISIKRVPEVCGSYLHLIARLFPGRNRRYT